MSRTGTILVVDDDDDILTAARLLLRRRFAEVVTCRRPERIPDLMEKHAFDVVLLDMNFGPGQSSGKQGLEWLERIMEIDPGVVVIMITAHGSVDTAVEAMKAGATEYLTKPFDLGQMRDFILKAIARKETADIRSRALREAFSPRAPSGWRRARPRRRRPRWWTSH